MLEKFTSAFIPIFFAIDVIGVLPLFLSMTRKLNIEKRRIITRQAAITAFVISFCFIYFGKQVFKVLGITISDFKIGGGILLLIIGIVDLLFSERTERGADQQSDTMGIVPVGMPLIIGPAVLTALLLSVGANGYNITLLALIVNILLVWIVFHFADKIIGVIGEAGAIAVGKVFSLLLMAIGVMLIRVGILDFLSLARGS
ncbi:MAG: MarC family protein [Oligoflexia bacterium]|nr:MarC family protein [Oligoflexia bacterium]